MSSSVRKAARKAERVAAAHAKVLAGCAKNLPPMQITDEASSNADALLNMIAYGFDRFEESCRGDRVIVARWLDADDIEFMQALRGEQGLPPEEVPPLPVTIHFAPRAELLAHLEASGEWSEGQLAPLRTAPLPGEALVVFDGTACGHGAAKMLSPARVSKGGQA